jgi:very-short-patch-repair endonuclease
MIFTKPEIKEKRQNLRNNMTETEKKLWKYLKNEQLGIKFRRQHSIGHYIADFYCPEKKMVIEIDGSQHYTEDGLEYDKIREEYMTALGIKTIRFSNSDVTTNIEGILILLKNMEDINGNH